MVSLKLLYRLQAAHLVTRRLGVKTRVFHLGDYRRATVGPGKDVPDDYFFVNGKCSGIELVYLL